METLWEQIYTPAAYWIESYGASQLLLVVTLSAITIFRREMSCNHCYQEKTEEEESKEEESKEEDWDDSETEELLERASRYCSAACLAPVLEKLKEALIMEELSRSMLKTEELLEGAGCFCSGFPYTAALLNRQVVTNRDTKPLNKPFVTDLPMDAQVQVLSFLHPRDVLNVASVNKDCRNLIEEGESSRAIWKSLWHRDYAWLVQSWPVGREAWLRSSEGAATPLFDKEFYFRFSLSFTNYLLAGQNTLETCLVGIGGHIYDLSLFLHSHPGSPETVQAHAGRDATAFFDGMNHSMGARRIAQSLCVVVDLSLLDRESCGTRPTASTRYNNDKDEDEENLAQDDAPPHVVNAPVTFNSQTVIRKKGTVQRIQDVFEQEKASFQVLVDNMKVPELLGDINLYYDPMQREWKAWYTSQSLNTVFIDKLNEDVLY